MRIYIYIYTYMRYGPSMDLPLGYILGGGDR